MKIFLKLKSGALHYSIFVAVIIAIILLAMIQLSFYTGIFSKRTLLFSNLHTELINHTNSYLGGDINNPTSEHTKIETSNWGVFELIKTSINIESYKFEKTALVGGYTQSLKRNALYLVDTHSPLVMAGSAIVNGNALMPKQGVKRGYIGGDGFRGSTLINGKTKNSTNNLPIINNTPVLPVNFEKIDIENIDSDSLSVSFSDTTKWFYSNDTIYLNNMELRGNIIIESKEAILVDNKTKFTDIILKAPNVNLLPKTNFTGQVIATNSISIANNSTLQYPSILYLKTDNDKSSITIAENSKVTGMVVFNTNSTKKDYNTAILIKEKAIVTGEVFSNKNIEIYGTVNGMVYTKKFVTHAKGGIYDNHFYNGKIDSKNLDDNYTGLLIGNNNKRIVKWLY